MDDTVIPRFWEKVDTSGDCWEWTASIGSHGYGQFSVGRETRTAHRMSWELNNGPVPSGMWVLHSCDNRKCVRPSHLYLGDRARNARDASERNRWPKSYAKGVSCKKGHPYTPENTYIRPDGERNCRTCRSLGRMR